MNIKALFGAAVVLAVVAYGATTSYLVHYDHETAPKLSSLSPTNNNPKAKAAFDTIAEARCDYCHTKDAKLPFYASLPVAKQLMQRDIKRGLQHFQIQPVLNALEKGEVVDEESLARMQFVVEHDMMPPKMYLTMHWHAALGEKGKKAMLEWIKENRIKNYDAAGLVAPQFQSEPIQPIPAADFSDKEKIALGERLFFDKQLSGDGTLNCASCHGLNKGGVDNLVTSTGIKGQKGPINAPTVYNSVYNKLQFWDGRAKDLQEQAAGPVMNPLEMGSHDWAEVSKRVMAQPGYKEAFTKVYGGQANQERITNAIAVYEATLVTPDSRFDQYLKGHENAINEQEKRGYALFKDLGCASCHVGKAMGGQSFEVMGLEGDYFGKRGHPSDADQGRFSQTHNALDMHRFNVPTLRNIELTAPYFHDGSAKTLEEAVREMVRYQTQKGQIPEKDVQDIVAFLKTQTGSYRGHNLATITEEEAGILPSK